MILFPLHRSGGFGGDVVDDTVNAVDLIGDPAGDLGQDVIRKPGPVGGHRILGGDRTQDDRVTIGAAIALHPH